jgi:predicted alpha/beta hydrolase family esterase
MSDTNDDPTADDDLERRFEALAPDAATRARMEGVVLAAHALSHRPLAVEWVALLREAPVSGTLLVAAAAAALLAATPLGALVALASRFV